MLSEKGTFSANSHLNCTKMEGVPALPVRILDTKHNPDQAQKSSQKLKTPGNCAVPRQAHRTKIKNAPEPWNQGSGVFLSISVQASGS